MIRDAWTVIAAIGGAIIVGGVGFVAVRAITAALGGHGGNYRVSVPVGIIAGLILFATLVVGKKGRAG